MNRTSVVASNAIAGISSSGQYLIVTDSQRDIRAKRVENASQLNRNVPCAHNQHLS
jgi:hypothetical protein